MNTHYNKISIHSTDEDSVATLQTVFERAGIIDSTYQNDTNSISSDQSVLIISDKGEKSFFEDRLKEMTKGLDDGTLLNGFIWNPKSKQKSSDNFESLISAHLSRNISYSTEAFVIRFVEDVIKTLETRTEENIKNNGTHMSVFYSVLDNQVGEDVTSMLSDIFTVNKIPVDISDDSSTIESLSKLALEANLCVVIFDQQKEWSELFTQEIWKKIGGVSSGVPILLIGSDANEPSKLSIPNVTVAEAGRDLLALEIKIQYDSLTQE